MQVPGSVFTSQVSRAVASDVEEMLPQLWGLVHPSSKRVPCNHPCSLMRADVPKLSAHKYWVGPKTDGVRTFLLLSFTGDEDYAVFVDRANNMQRCRLTARMDVYSGTLLDGELVTHADGTTTYLVFDAIAVNGYSMTRKLQSERMAEVVRTVSSLSVQDPALSVKVKRWFSLNEVDLHEVAASAGITPTDGFIFVPEYGQPLRPGQQHDHFKWKPASHHTIDMLWREARMWVEKAGVPEPASTLGITQVDLGDVDLSEGTVVECAMTRVNPTEWSAKCVRVRPDKLHPNDARVARLTLQNVDENILLEELQ